MDARGPIDIATFGFALPRPAESRRRVFSGSRSRQHISPVLQNARGDGGLVAGIVAASSLIVPAVILGVRLFSRR